MPIKRIQLRGISRRPSDRMNADGGCAESLNMYIDENELASRVDMTEVTTSTTGSNAYSIAFIHKMPDGTRAFIGYKSNKLVAYVNGSSVQFKTGSSSSDYAGVDSGPSRYVGIGNILIAYTSLTPYYFLFKDGSYKVLGMSIPKPEIEVITIPHSPTRSSSVRSKIFGLPDYFSDINSAVLDWNTAKSESSAHHADLLAAMSSLWECASLLISEIRSDGYFNAPFFLRYAVRLYDGSYIHASTPILCGGSVATWIAARRQQTGGASNHWQGVVSLQNGFWVGLKMASYDIASWGDIVSSIDFFISTPIYTPSINAGFSEMYVDDGTAYIRFSGEEDDVIEDNIRKEVLSKGNFYKILSVALDSDGSASVYSEMLSGTYRIKNTDDIGMGENLLVKEAMPDPYRSSNTYKATGGSPLNSNSRIILPGVTEVLTTGDIFLNGLVSAKISASRTTKKRWIFKYHIEDANGAGIVASRGHESALGLYSLEAGYFTSFDSDTIQHFAEDTDNSGCEATPYAWLAYPDRRCKSVTVYYYEGSTLKKSGTIVMEPHPFLECAYAFFGLGEVLNDELTAVQGSPSYSYDTFSDEKRTIGSPNKLFISELENPFLFPAGNIITFSDNLIGVAQTTVPLSEGQAGQFPYYVFTEGGIRALSVNTEGTISAKVVPPNIAQHVAVAGSIKQLDQEIVFVTNRGVMLLSGYEVRCISEVMNGKHDTLNSGVTRDRSGNTGSTIVSSALSGWAGSSMLSAATDTTAFISFVKGASIAYDYNDERLIFIRSNLSYQYVYHFKTNTWHKMYPGKTFSNVLNSFPDCLVTADGAGGVLKEIYDLSTINDNAAYLVPDSTKFTYGLTVTRALDLDEPDVHKVIKSIRIRGNFNRNNVQYLILGSLDGVNWKLLPSLRGGSYKQFKLVIVSKLDRTERISWVDVDYESRYATKLR